MPSTAISSESGEGWVLITLSSPAGLNKLGTDTLVPLRDTVVESLAGECRCLGILGEGGSFAVGADLREIGALTPAAARKFSELGNSLFGALERADTLVVAGIDGFCLGGGLDLALAADWRLATARSVFGHPGSDLGLITGFGGTQRLPRLVGASTAAKWLYTAARFPAAEAYAAGLVQETCREDEFHTVLRERVRKFSRFPSDRIRAVKADFRRQSDGVYGYPGACGHVR